MAQELAKELLSDDDRFCSKPDGPACNFQGMHLTKLVDIAKKVRGIVASGSQRLQARNSDAISTLTGTLQSNANNMLAKVRSNMCVSFGATTDK